MISVFVAERILRFMISIEKKSLTRTKSGILHPSSRATLNAIQYWKAILRTIFRLNTHPWSWIVIVGFLIFIWYIPQIFDYASTHENVHVMQHISFIMVGAGVFVTIRLLGESFNLFLIFSLIGMMGL
jgi:Cytochrome c oxidase caa3 assembly factor (Caa3_CtaG)